MRLEGWKRLAMTNGIGIRRLEKDRVNDGCLLRRKNNDKRHFFDCAILFYALMVSCV